MDVNALESLIPLIPQFTAVQYCKVALITLFLADYLQTLPTEVDFLWPASWSIVKFVYYVSRYSPMIDIAILIFTMTASSPSSEVCTGVIRATIWSSSIGPFSAQILFIYRAYALLGQTRLVAILLSIFATVVLLSAVVLLVLLNIHVSVENLPVPSALPGCLMTSSSTSEQVYAIAGIIAAITYESVLFVIIGWVRFRRCAKIQRSWLMKKIYDDVFIYYSMSLIVSGSGIIVWFSSNGPLRDLSSSMPRYLLSIISCRIILHIRRYGNEGPVAPRATDSTHMRETLRFVHPVRPHE